MEEVGVGLALAAEDLGPVVHPARLRPALLGQPDGPAFEVEHEHRLVVAVGLVAVDVGAHLGVDAGDSLASWPSSAEHPAEELDRVAAHVHRHPAAAAPGVVEPAGVRPVVLLGLLDQVDPAERPSSTSCLEPDVLRSEAELLGVAEHHPGSLAGGDHPVALGQAQGHRLLDDDVLAGQGGLEGRLAVQVVGQAEHDQVDLRTVVEGAVIGEVVGDRPARRRTARRAPAWARRRPRSQRPGPGAGPRRGSP